MGGASFLQTPEAGRLRKIAEMFQFSDEYDRNNVLAFLEQSGDYVPQSGQIVGILKQMLDSMNEQLTAATADEEKAVAGYGELKASKDQEAALGKEAVSQKNARAGELAVSTVEAEGDLEDNKEELASVTKLMATLKESCATKEKEWAERVKGRNEEIQAISEAIKILNDDDALDVFKKAMPASLMQANTLIQRSNTQATAAHRAAAILAKLTGG